MRSTKTFSLSLPQELFSRLTELAKKEKRTMSELVIAALQTYERERWWDETNAYGRARAQELGIREEDVEAIIHDFRVQKCRK